MNTTTGQPNTDPNTWPVVECESAEVFLGTFDHDCTPGLSADQRGWPTAECDATDARGGAGNPAPPR